MEDIFMVLQVIKHDTTNLSKNSLSEVPPTLRQKLFLCFVFQKKNMINVISAIPGGPTINEE
jgi:hypothetical protein